MLRLGLSRPLSRYKGATLKMGAKTWMLVTSTGDACDSLVNHQALNRDATFEYAKSLFPNETLSELPDGDLYYTNPPDNQIFAGCFGDVKIIAAKEFGIDYPSKLPQHFVPKTGLTTLHAMHSVVDWFAFAHWNDGKLIRSLSLSPDHGIMEDFGEQMEFETPYWNGDFPAVDDDEEDYAFKFHPLELGEATLLNFFGYQIEGYVDKNKIEPEDFPLMQFERATNSSTKPWWKIW